MRELGVEHGGADLEVGVEGLAGDEEAHDLAGAFEDGVDAAIAQETLDGDGLLAAAGEGLGGLVAAAAADLHGLVDDLPGPLGGPELADGGFEADVGVLVAVDEAGGVEDHGFHGEGLGGHAGELLGDGGVLADGGAPLDAVAGPFAGDRQAALGEAGAGGRQGQAAGVEGGEGDAQAFALGEQDVLARDADIGEADDAVVEGPEAHEMAAVRDLDAGRVHIHDEGGDAAALLAGWRRASWPLRR